jgi:hypothetical protein
MSHPDADRAAPAFGHKVNERHRERLAVVYVQQSTARQVQRHRESTQLQYGLVERATDLGWPRGRVLVIDDDLGLSGTSADRRPGFQQLQHGFVTTEDLSELYGYDHPPRAVRYVRGV